MFFFKPLGPIDYYRCWNLSYIFFSSAGSIRSGKVRHGKSTHLCLTLLDVEGGTHVRFICLINFSNPFFMD